MKKNHFPFLISPPALAFGKSRWRAGHFSFSKGFTLVELLIVIAVIGVLAGGVLAAINPIERIAQAKDSTRKATVSQLVNALQSYYTLSSTEIGKYPTANNTWIDALINNGDIKNAPPPIPIGNPPCATQQNGYCYKTNADRSEAIVYAPLESSVRPSGTSGTTPYILWSSASSENGVYYSVAPDIVWTSGFVFGQESTLTQGLAGWWKMNDNANDSSGNNNNGTVNGATLAPDKNGQFNKAYSFNGTSDYIDVGSGASLKITGTSITAAAWINPSGWGSNNEGRIVDNVNLYQNGYWFTLENRGAGSAVQSLKFSIFNSGVPYHHYANDNSVSLNTWRHVAVTYDGQNVRFYINGVPGGTRAQTVSIGSGTNLAIGRMTVAARWFAGLTDDVRIYNRTLSSGEITNLFNAGPQ